MSSISLYPRYDEVFATDELIGIYYPLATVTDDEGRTLQLVSSTGLWSEDEDAVTTFRLEDGRYTPAGPIPPFEGADGIRAVYELLEDDFAQRGEEYLAGKVTAKTYLKGLEERVSELASEDLDLEHYLTTFYSFAINRLVHATTGASGNYRHVIDGWGASDGETVLVGYDEGLLEELPEDGPEIPEGAELFAVLIGSEFFQDGNDEIHLFDAETDTLVVVPTGS